MTRAGRQTLRAEAAGVALGGLRGIGRRGHSRAGAGKRHAPPPPPRPLRVVDRLYIDAVNTLPASLSSVAATVERLLTEHGPLSATSLARALERSDLILGADARDVLEKALDAGALPLVVQVAGGRHAFLPALLAGRAFTHRVTPLELAHDVLEVDPDLGAALIVAADDERFRHLVGGADVDLAMPGLDDGPLRGRGLEPDTLTGDEYALLPPGTLAGAGRQAGDLVAVALTDAGWSITPAARAEASDPARLRDQVRARLGRPNGEPQDLTLLVWDLCATTDLFTHPELPVSELLAAWGLERHGDVVAREGFDIDRWRVEQRVRHVAETYRIDEDDALAVVVLGERFRTVERLLADLAGLDAAALERTLDEIGDAAMASDEAPAPSDDAPSEAETLAALTAALADADVAEALLAETLGAGTEGAAALGMFSETLLPLASDEAHPALSWFLAKAHDRRGDLATAEAVLRDVVGRAPFAPALRDLARYASDRGNAAEALDLLRRAGVGRDDGEVALLTHMSQLAAHDLGRNQPCWCGSGRKYKVCHLGKEELPLAERAAWLYQKAGAFTQDGPWREDILDVAVERARFSRSELALYEALGDGLVIDAVMFEGGAFEAFLADRGPLLPDDERLLAGQWLLVDRSVHEVMAVRPGTSITLRDVRTGDVRVVRERTASRTLTVGTLLCARVVPAGDTWQVFGGAEPVALHERESLVALLDAGPDPTELVAFLSRRFAPPTLANTEGDAFEMHEVLVRMSDPAAVVARLDAEYERRDDEGFGTDDGQDRVPDGVWHERVPGREQIRTFLHRYGDALEVSTNSTPRAERVLAVLRDADPALEVVGHERRTVEEMVEIAERLPEQVAVGGAGGTTPSGIPEEAVAEAISGLMRRYEESWPDEQIPALAGLTPRQAVADPTRRDDVVRLLRSFPPPTPTSMNRERIAAALGLDLGTD